MHLPQITLSRIFPVFDDCAGVSIALDSQAPDKPGAELHRFAESMRRAGAERNIRSQAVAA
jgi:hypothetical protein